MPGPMNRSLRRCTLIAALACSLVTPTAFALTASDVAPLAGDDFEAKAAAIDTLAAKHDPAALELLGALAAPLRELPLLVVGRRQVTGFAAAAWNEALDSASYPRKAMLPPGYRTGAAEAAAPASLPAPPPRLPVAPAPDAAAAQAGRQQPRQQPQPKKSPPDFQF